MTRVWNTPIFVIATVYFIAEEVFPEAGWETREPREQVLGKEAPKRSRRTQHRGRQGPKSRVHAAVPSIERRITARPVQLLRVSDPWPSPKLLAGRGVPTRRGCRGRMEINPLGNLFRLVFDGGDKVRGEKVYKCS